MHKIQSIKYLINKIYLRNVWEEQLAIFGGFGFENIHDFWSTKDEIRKYKYQNRDIYALPQDWKN